jgi:hypothetical protein
MSCFYLNTYTPLISSSFGRQVVREHQLPPLIDGSIRREPDLEHPFPGISCLCRGSRFAPRLQVGDVVGYLTRKGRYEGRSHPHWRLTALLKVCDVTSTHDEAATWYRQRGLPLPSNCLVEGNPPKPLALSHKLHQDRNRMDGERLAQRWDRQYAHRARKYSTYVVCQRLFHDLHLSAPFVTEAKLKAAFGRIPGTQNPGKLDFKSLSSFLKLLNVSVELSSP